MAAASLLHLRPSLTVVNTTDRRQQRRISPGDGGGLYCDVGSTATLVNATISGNEAGDDGGGIYGLMTTLSR